jgi:hypothetical protein
MFPRLLKSTLGTSTRFGAGVACAFEGGGCFNTLQLRKIGSEICEVQETPTRCRWLAIWFITCSSVFALMGLEG